MAKKNLAVVGFGGMGGWHVNHALNSDVVELSGIFDIDPQKQDKAKKEGIFVYDSLDEIINDNSVDVVTVAIPNDDHLSTVTALLKGKKHVICEKPAALSSVDLCEMQKAAEAGGVLFTCHQNRRFDVDFLAMNEIAKSNELGEVINIESRIHGSRGIPSDWRGQKKHGGGMLYDWGVHLIDQIIRIMGENVLRVNCSYTHITNEEVDDGYRLELIFKNGARAYSEVGTYNFIPLPRFYMQCKSGTALISDWREEAKVVKCKYWHESDVLPVATAAGLTKTMAPRDGVTVDEYSYPRPSSDVHDFYRNFCNAIDGKEKQMVTFEQLLYVIRIIETAQLSERLGKPVDFIY